MKFKTTIEIISEAENKNEAMEIVGEYLSGYLASGVDMRCSTRIASTYNKPVIAIVISTIILTVSILSLGHIKPSKGFVGSVPGFNAVQAPLKTPSNANEAGFKKEWFTRQTREALNRIKK